MDLDLPSSELDSGPDIASEVLTCYQTSSDEHHRLICVTIEAISQTLKDNKLPKTPVSYFGATVSSLDRISGDPNSGSDPITAAQLSVLSFVMTRVSPNIVRKKWDVVNEVVLRILIFVGLPVDGVKAGVKCLALLLRVSEKGSWDRVVG